MRTAVWNPWEVFAVRCLMGSSGLFVAAWLRVFLSSRKIFLGSICDVLICILWFTWILHLHVHTNTQIGLSDWKTRLALISDGILEVDWQDFWFSKSRVEWNDGWWLVMLGHPSESETRSQGAELDLLAWLCQELSGCKSVDFQQWGVWSQLSWAKVRHYRDTQEDEGLPGCTSAWFATAGWDRIW